jgi:hypothetical protein
LCGAAINEKWTLSAILLKSGVFKESGFSLGRENFLRIIKTGAVKITNTPVVNGFLACG